MKRTLTALWAMLLVLFLVPLPLHAADTSRVVDGADLLTSKEEAELAKQAQEISEKFDTNVFILTGYSEGYSSNYARDYIEEYGETYYPEGYIGMMVNMADRSYWVDAFGQNEREIFTQSQTDSMAENVFDALVEGDYYYAAKGFLDKASRRFEIKSSPLGFLKKLYLYPFWTFALLAVSLFGALGIAGGMAAMKASKHRDKKLAVHAGQYAGDLNLQANENRFIRHYQTRVRRLESSGGRSGGFGGGGGGGHTGSGGHF